MKLKLALVLTCNENGSSVKTVPDNSTFEAVFSSLVVQKRIKIQPDQLVAINMDANPPEIVWRWLRAVVLETGGDTVVVDDIKGHPAKVSSVSDLPLTLDLDDEVWVCGTGRDFEIHDILLKGKPAHPDRLLKYILPIIKEIYQL